ncbi:MAG: A/G-specific adenine glycosylase [Butyrivibrio sp.]|nr:A/G-specific adenine glycosylase [Acetatifactor muris]MCM1561522.1 A/G-specific adenine glycosylase [Butyrivibrio sp.]
MKYNNITPARFVSRPNRFVAYVELKGKTEKVHVKNTGRCRELLQPGVTVYLTKSENRARSTAYDLVAVEKGERIINMDSQAPNRVVEEWLREGAFLPDIRQIRPETVYGNSRFDFYLETKGEKIFMEVKGVTLEEEGIVRFPDAPSERAVKHVEELIRAKGEGYRTFVMFVIQMEGVDHFEPNRDTHPEFADALCRAAEAGVEILAYNCRVTGDSLALNRPVPVRIKENLRLAAIPKPLLEWYDKSRRILPWRENPTPYRVWVSEIMLQQTRVEAVRPYFERFMSALPDIGALAEAPEEQLLKLWEGLGYYNRVRNLQRAAVQIVSRYGGEMPGEYEELLKLTGIGSYTAGAIASIAYGRPVPAVDGNVLRVLARLRKDERLITDGKVKTAVEQELSEIMPGERPGDFNQAMMELGACVCIPGGRPLCGACPLSQLCMAHADGTETEFPKKEGKKPRKIEEKTVLVIRDENRAAIRKRPAKGLLAGMYEFPMLEGSRTAEEVTAYLAENGIRVLRIRPLEDARHIFTHKEWHMKGYMVRADELDHGSPGEDSRSWLFVEPGETEERYPIPSAFSAYTKYLKIRLGKERYEEE